MDKFGGVSTLSLVHPLSSIESPSFFPTSEKDVRRFWRYVEKGSSCWLWIGYTTSKGYGSFRYGDRRLGLRVRAHRASWQLHFGPIPDDLFVCHHCDVPNCVRPDHLFLGTHQDNMSDMLRKRG